MGIEERGLERLMRGDAALKILVVDGDADARASVCRKLTHAGHTVESVGNGDDALLACAPYPPDIVILDVNLPESDGYTVSERIRRHVDHPDMAVIFLSGAARDAHRLDVEQSAAGSGGDYFVAKPCDPEVLARLVCRIMAKSPPEHPRC